MEKYKKHEYYQVESGNVVIKFSLNNYVDTLYNLETFRSKNSNN